MGWRIVVVKDPVCGKFFSSPILQLVSDEQLPGSRSLLSAIILTVNLRSDRTSSRTRAVFSLVRFVDGRPLRCPSSTKFLLSENILCQQTRLEMSGTYSKMSHCKAMPLQIGIEEGLRSTAVCVGGLQYCQDGQKKISLITLLSDLVNNFNHKSITV